MPRATWDVRVRAKREVLWASIPAEWKLTNPPTIDECPKVTDWTRNLLSEDEITITETPPLATLTNIHASVWSAEDVTRAFCHRAALAHQLVNCLTEILFTEAIAIAQELDRRQKETGLLQGPLHGLPVSFMDRFRITGVETSAGFVSWLGPKESPETESLLVRHMRALGAIPFCKTNLPQSMMLGTTTNNIFGSTANPFNRILSAGGAAGGEGALLAMRGSPFGWATDIAGSSRIPATFNNLFAMRVSTGRLPTHGIAFANATLPLCNATVGMITWDLPLLQHMSRLVLGSLAHQEDSQWLDMAWREMKFRTFQKRRPPFAVLMHDGHICPQPPVQRALATTCQALQQQGYQVVAWNPPPHAPAVENLFRIIGADGAVDIRANMRSSGEPPVQQLKQWFFDAKQTQSLSTSEFWSLCKARNDYLATYHAYWISSRELTSSGHEVDGVIMPVLADAACLENELTYFGCSAIVNHLDYTSVCFPVTFVDHRMDLKEARFVALNAEDARVQNSYDPDAFEGAPVGLQVMCRRVEEETALALTGVIVQALDATKVRGRGPEMPALNA